MSGPADEDQFARLDEARQILRSAIERLEADLEVTSATDALLLREAERNLELAIENIRHRYEEGEGTVEPPQ